MSAQGTSFYCFNTDNKFCHAVKGTGYLCSAACTSLAILVVAAVTLLFSAGLLLQDAGFIYRYTVLTPANLCWVIPVGIAGIGLSLLVIYGVGTLALSAITGLAGLTKTAALRVKESYTAVIRPRATAS